MRLPVSTASISNAFALLREHKVRSGLTVLGIAVGIWAVVTLLAIGMGARSYIEGQVQILGSDLLVVTPGSSEDPTSFFNPVIMESLTLADAEHFRNRIPDVHRVAAVFQLSGELSVADKRAAGSVVGTEPDYFALRELSVDTGRLLNRADQRSAAPVAVLGAELAQQLFGNQPPLGESIRFRGQPLEVVGVLSQRDDAALGQGEDRNLFVPIRYAQRALAGAHHVEYIMVEPTGRETKDAVARAIDLHLMTRKSRLSNAGKTHTVTDFGEIATLAGRIVDAMTWTLVSIAGVSLVVGGIGVMNVMLASVSERVSEIGIRRAVGANANQIRLQFLSEAAMLTVVGGVVGLCLAFISILLANQLLPWEGSLTVTSVLLVLLFSASIGGFFGYYPARKAANMPPMEALRYD
ncbi:ABC transporter permease [Alkalilimnicola ehrlichii MLHE-1]|uniref:ABC transporter permease n=1 Tax=Alkalilimnicola ehrlichii (strain ATCC BAA-1101 / DSM 17681 / MLHE-1) TaxID=187272 RepID=Q0A6P7_ALKEH|nr:ABC transporter permease [Alkalilimnicola ehrlichii]ABI57490.1 protein of unknown function DUF214 [Alkalilimnicola ehrlichii MLHE-1]